MVKSLASFYFIDCKKQRDSMISYQQEGAPNHLALELEIQIFKIYLLYLKEIDYDNKERNLSVLRAFIDSFVIIDE
jgi:hypothetical protein